MKELNTSKTNYELIKNNLREAIITSSVPQCVIALNIGVSAQTVSKYVNGDVFPSLDTFAKLCVFLDVSSDELLGIKNN